MALIVTESVGIQQATEAECQPFFVDIQSLRKHSQEHLRDSGLLPNQDDPYPLDVCLLRDKHFEYLSRVFLPSRQPLGRNLVSLDASRPWMMYWALHGCDLLLVPDTTKNKSANDCNSHSSNNLLSQRVGDTSLCAVVQTLEACWQSLELPLPQYIQLTDNDQSLLHTISDPTNGDDPSKKQQRYQAGGFGGGPGQMAHAATTYAAILSLCIVATSEGPLSSPMAWAMLSRIRKPLYAWFLSLQQPCGGFRMHHDGEIDVRGKLL